MKKILLVLLIAGLVILSFASGSKVANATSGTAGVGDECNVQAPDESHTCSEGLVCVPQNDNSEGNGKCQNAESTPTPTPGDQEHHKDCVENACVQVEGAGDNTCNNDNDCETTPTPTNTPSNPGGGSGDGRSDNLGCGSHDCSSHPTTTQAVLGLSTTSSDSNTALQFAQLLGALMLSSTGFALFRKRA